MPQWRTLVEHFTGPESNDWVRQIQGKTMEHVVELIGILRQLRSPGVLSDDDQLLTMTRDAIVDKSWFENKEYTRKMKLVTKTLVYAKMFQRNDIGENINQQVFEFAHRLLRMMHTTGWLKTEEEVLLCRVIWYLFGRTMFTYLFRLVDLLRPLH